MQNKCWQKKSLCKKKKKEKPLSGVQDIRLGGTLGGTLGGSLANVANAISKSTPPPQLGPNVVDQM